MKPVFVALTRSLFAEIRLTPARRAAQGCLGRRQLPANAEIRAIGPLEDGVWYEVATKQGQTAYVHADAVSDFRASKPVQTAARPSS